MAHEQDTTEDWATLARQISAAFTATIESQAATHRNIYAERVHGSVEDRALMAHDVATSEAASAAQVAMWRTFYDLAGRYPAGDVLRQLAVDVKTPEAGRHP